MPCPGGRRSPDRSARQPGRRSHPPDLAAAGQPALGGADASAAAPRFPPPAEGRARAHPTRPPAPLLPRRLPVPARRCEPAFQEAPCKFCWPTVVLRPSFAPPAVAGADRRRAAGRPRRVGRGGGPGEATRAESARLVDADRRIGASLPGLGARAGGPVRRPAGRHAEPRWTRASAAVDNEIAERTPGAPVAPPALAPVLAGQSIADAQLQVLQIDAAIALLQQERALAAGREAARAGHAVGAGAARRAGTPAPAPRRRLRAMAGGRARARGAGPPARAEEPGQAGHGFEHRQLRSLNERLAQLRADGQRAAADYRRQRALVDGTLALPPLAPLSLQPAAVDDALQPLRARIDDLLADERTATGLGLLWRPAGRGAADGAAGPAGRHRRAGGGEGAVLLRARADGRPPSAGSGCCRAAPAPWRWRTARVVGLAGRHRRCGARTAGAPRVPAERIGGRREGGAVAVRPALPA
ncbi:MAG: hypothetical protein MZW92_42295 [Comamonadaceae bacterium]|nr:hypothetical protein [Comamonadaceae bacterium]